MSMVVLGPARSSRRSMYFFCLRSPYEAESTMLLHSGMPGRLCATGCRSVPGSMESPVECRSDDGDGSCVTMSQEGEHRISGNKHEIGDEAAEEVGNKLGMMMSSPISPYAPDGHIPCTWHYLACYGVPKISELLLGPGLSPKARPSPARASSSPAWPDIRLDRAQGSGLGNLRPAEARQARARLCIRQAESPALGKLSGAWLSLAECHLLPNRIFSDLLQDQASAPAGMTPRTGRPRLEPGLEAWAGLDAGSGSGSANVKPKPAKAQPKPGLLGPARP
ncbi:hypothetical protein FB45DRAFT_1007572 [Roridomyces roridus]|uniref:Uncharacterized protein n=1 Tax=Roridomyces roridus TaxID=1738132 RepID=A0AAD7FDN2_9AGAR|nr:hypothetical protein FB45DRAFT_1007572 [Roridomyces roridus]